MLLNIYRLGRKKDDALRHLLVKLRSEKLIWDINGMSHPIYVTWDKTVIRTTRMEKVNCGT